MIEFRNVTCGYDIKKPIFREKTFSIAKNRVSVILGLNGCGKSTLLKCLINQLNCFSGNILINNEKISTKSINEISRLMAYVPQNFLSTINYNVIDFIVFGRTPYLNLFNPPNDADYEKAFAFSSQIGISHLLDKSVNEISGGEKQLVYIARAMIQETPIIIMDEPMSALDFTNQASILNIISFLAHEDKTIVITSHNPNHALSIASDVLLIDKKHNIITGNAKELLLDEKIIRDIFGQHVILENDTVKFKIN